jgi:hypothetical protein
VACQLIGQPVRVEVTGKPVRVVHVDDESPCAWAAPVDGWQCWTCRSKVA